METGETWPFHVDIMRARCKFLLLCLMKDSIPHLTAERIRSPLNKVWDASVTRQPALTILKVFGTWINLLSRLGVRWKHCFMKEVLIFACMLLVFVFQVLARWCLQFDST